jgi:hypothetical protein
VGRSAHRWGRALLGVTAVTVISGTLTGLGVQRASASTALSVATIGVYIGSGTHNQPITIPAGSSIVGTSEPIVVSGLGWTSIVVGVSAGSSTHASCTKGSSYAPFSDFAFTCTPSAGGWGAGELYFAVNIPKNLPASMAFCANGGCAIDTNAAWENGPDTIRADGNVNIFVPKTAAPATSSSSKRAPSSTVSTAAGSVARSVSPSPSLSAAVSPSPSMTGAAAPSPSASGTDTPSASPSGTRIDGAPVAHSSGGFLPVVLVVPVLAGFGVAIGIFAGRRRRRRNTASGD